MIGALLAKDARLLVRNRPLLVALLLYPFLLAAVLGAAFQEPPSTLDLVVVDDDASSRVDVAGENLTTQDLLDTARAFAVIRHADTVAEAESILREGEADAALHIPRGFLGNLSTLGTNATLLLVVDESDPVRSGVAQNAVEGAIDAFVKQIIQKKLDEISVLLQAVNEGGEVRVAFTSVELMGIDEAVDRLQEVEETLAPGSAERATVADVIGFMLTTQLALGSADVYLTTTALPLTVQSRGLAAQPASLAAIALPGALVLGVFWTGALAAALLFAREHETGVARRLRAAPVRAWWTWSSKTIVALVAALVPAALLVALGALWLGAPVASPTLAALVLVAASLAAAAIGALAARVARATSGAALLAVLLLLPMLLLGGLFYPVSYMPEAAQAVARALPVTLATDALRGALVRGSSLAELAAPLFGLVAFAAVALAAAVAFARRA